MTRLIATIILFYWLSPAAHAAEHLFYVLHSRQHDETLYRTLSRIEQNASSIDIIVSQAYQLDANGKLNGYINQEIIDLAQAKSLKVMAMITNAGFDQAQAHRFLTTKNAQKKALEAILAACKQYHLYGVQFDFEMISVKDKQALTAFFREAARRLHGQGYAVSVAVVPALSDKPGPSAFLQKYYENWSGAYDLKALGTISDFITLMTYNQHAEGTTPGPAASLQWVEQAVIHALKYIPVNKLSLGIPAYSLYWYTGKNPASHTLRVSTRREEISYDIANKIMAKFGAHASWDEKDKLNYSIYERNWLNEYIYLEDADSMQVKMELAHKYKLRGISVFRIGTEDPRIWAALNSDNRSA